MRTILLWPWLLRFDVCGHALFVAALLILQDQFAFGQQDAHKDSLRLWNLGVSGGPLHVGYTHSDIHSKSYSVIQKTAMSGAGWYVALDATLLFKEGWWGVKAGIRYASRPASHVMRAMMTTTVRNGGSAGDVVDTVAPIQVALALDQEILEASCPIFANVLSLAGTTVNVVVGPTTILVLRSHRRETVELLGEGDWVFVNPQGFDSESGGRRLLFFNGELSKTQRFNMGLRLGVGTATEIARALHVVAAFEFDLTLMPFVHGGQTRAYAFSAGIGVRVDM